MSNVYTATKRDLAHVAAKDFRGELAGAVASGVAASAQSTADLSTAAGMSEGNVTRISSASELSLEDAFHLAQHLDDAGYTAFYNDVITALENAAPEGWTPPA